MEIFVEILKRLSNLPTERERESGRAGGSDDWTVQRAAVADGYLAGRRKNQSEADAESRDK